VSQRSDDGSAGDADYGQVGGLYSQYRRPDPRIAARIVDALGDARTVLNVGAGAGSYEAVDREVTPVEPSASMRAQRPAHLAPAIDATAENLPFADASFDAAMTTFSVHQWSDLRAGLREMRRVTRGPIVFLTGDPDLLRRFWLNDYAPEVLDTEARRTTAGRKHSWIRARDCRAQRGASSGQRCTTDSRPTWAATWPTGHGTAASATSAPSPHSTARSSSWSRRSSEERYSVLLNSAIAMPNMISPSTATTAISSRVGTRQPPQVTPGSSFARTAADT
jgi:SAM-dependent methyltransferase